MPARRYPELSRPTEYTQRPLGWVPWIEPLAPEQLTEAHLEALIEPKRAGSPYFRLLARDPAALKARTLTDLDIFHNEDGGLPRAERELAATAASRVNGCVFCASVHSRFATQLSGRGDDVQRLLDDGRNAMIDERWDAIVAVAAAVTATPPRFGADEIARLRGLGFDDAEIVDLLGSSAFFNWANRLMLSLGEPEVVQPSA